MPNKKLLLFLLISIFLTCGAQAGCLDGIDGCQTITSKIRGFYAKNGTSQIVILDKKTCTTYGSEPLLKANTKSYYYLQFDSSNKFLASVLLTAYAKGDIVKFRLKPGVSNSDYNEIAYVVSPSNARSQ
ncbi:MAG: hypothetical protein GY714_31890 [Desulfobacterales bacterium]|nr:hypothetical protein [Desulfobacterales bacterium]